MIASSRCRQGFIKNPRRTGVTWRTASPPADDEEAIRENLESWDTLAHLHAQGSGAEFYRIEQWLAGESKLAPWEIEEMGSVQGKSLLHMQCHIGTDTLSWAHEGARVVGLDFSPNAIAEAERFSGILGFDDARFVVSRVSDAVEALDGEQFEIIYTGRGALCWLPDLGEWARVCAALLKRDGVLYLEESTPMFNILDAEEGPDGPRLVPKYDLFNEGPISEIGEGSYASVEADIERTTHCWEYRYDTVINALLENGFRLDFLNERDELFFAPWPEVFEPSRLNYWRLKEGHVPIPLSVTLKATRL
jgi:SAM-dependent methyltransferase